MNWHTERQKKVEWLQTLKAGDEVVVYSSHSFTRSNYYLSKVVRVTKAQLVVVQNNRPNYEQKFWIKNGKLVGGRDSYDYSHLIPRSEEVDAEFNRQRIDSKFFKALDWLQRNHLEIEDKENIADFVIEISKRIKEKEQKRLDALAELQKESQEMGLYDGDKTNA